MDEDNPLRDKIAGVALQALSADYGLSDNRHAPHGVG